MILYHYDVAIKDHTGKEFSPSLPRAKNMRIFEKMRESFPLVFNFPMSYDCNKNAYSSKFFPQLKKATTYEVSLEPEEKKTADGKKGNWNNFKITIQKVNEASLKELFDCMRYRPGKKHEMPTTIMQMIEVMFRHYRAKKYEQISNRNFFSIDEEFAKHHDIGGGKCGVTGFFGSLRPAAWKDGSILLNLDMAHTAFYKTIPIIDFLKEIDDYISFDSTLPPYNTRNFSKALKTLKVKTTYSVRSYKIKELHTAGPRKTFFDFTDDKGKTSKVSVEQYFKKVYPQVKLKYPDFNCLNVGNQNKDVFVPTELCIIDKGQKVKKKLSEKEVASFIRSTAVPPQERLRQINKVAERNDFNRDEMLKALTFTISDKPLQTKGRILPAPNLTMDKNRFEPNSGVWDLRYNKFHNPGELKTWAVINYDSRTRDDTLNKFLNELMSQGRSKGMRISSPFDVYTCRDRNPNPSNDFKYYKEKQANIQLIMCVLPGRKFYGAIKTAGDTEHGIISQCVVSSNVFKCNIQTIVNILLKINAKIGGVNTIVTAIPQRVTGLILIILNFDNFDILNFPQDFREPFMILGADVNHPPAGGDSSIPSIAAVVGSYDTSGTKYAVERRAQEHRVENIVDMTEITMNLLRNFRQKVKRPPSRIIMYRDGVSESQFPQVLAKEMMAMRKACLTLTKDGSYTPGITFICVQKRHHTRLFCDEKYVRTQKNKNVPPGTIVDRDITHPTETDFFLCSH
ncbi:Protein argonaute-2, partial [Armadillidium nasatum]